MTALEKVHAWVAKRKRPFVASQVRIPGVIKPHVDKAIRQLVRVGKLQAIGQRRKPKPPGALGGRPENIWSKT